MNRRQGVLLTGATGALGPALAAELLAAQPRLNLDILLRAGSSSISQRFNDWLDCVACVISADPARFGGLREDDWRDRVTPVAGDVAIDQFGLERRGYDELARRANVIIHAAADTQFLTSLEQQRNINVGGTRRALEFASHCRSLSRIVLVSTICTSGTATGTIRETTMTPPGFVNNYERTKWEAEQLAMSSDLPLGIARVSIVIGSHASGVVHRIGAFHNVLKWFGRGLVPVVPGTSDTLVDLVCNEVVAAFIVRAALTEFKPRSIWHVSAGDRAATLPQLAEAAFEELRGGETVQSLEQPGEPFIIDHEIFERIRLSKTGPRDRVLRQSMEAINSFLPMLMYPRRYDTRQAEKLWGGPLPWPDWRETLARVIRTSGLAPRNAKTRLSAA
jgi:thioester reductase-like protein